MVLRTYQQSGFLSHNAVRLIATHSTHNRFGLLGALVRYSVLWQSCVLLYFLPSWDGAYSCCLTGKLLTQIDPSEAD